MLFSFTICHAAKFIPSDGVFTKTVNVGDTGVEISMTEPGAVEPDQPTIRWRKDGGDTLSVDGLVYTFPNAIVSSDEGIYEIYYDGERNTSRGSLYRLIVRGNSSAGNLYMYSASKKKHFLKVSPVKFYKIFSGDCHTYG